jgi:hypothetical protein
VLVVATLGTVERRHVVSRRARQRNAEPLPEPAAVSTGRVTLVDVASPLESLEEARMWLERAGEDQLTQDLDAVNRALFSFRIATADPFVAPVVRDQALVARVGFGVGEEVADGAWTQARELIAPVHRQRRTKVLAPQARLAGLLGGRERPLICEELILRARLDLDQQREREAALQLLVALDAALAELPGDPAAESLDDRIEELREQRDPVTDAAQAALAGPLDQAEFETVVFVLGRIEAALRARAAATQKLTWTRWGGSS